MSVCPCYVSLPEQWETHTCIHRKKNWNHKWSKRNKEGRNRLLWIKNQFCLNKIEDGSVGSHGSACMAWHGMRCLSLFLPFRLHFSSPTSHTSVIYTAVLSFFFWAVSEAKKRNETLHSGPFFLFYFRKLDCCNLTAPQDYPITYLQYNRGRERRIWKDSEWEPKGRSRFRPPSCQQQIGMGAIFSHFFPPSLHTLVLSLA